MKTLIRDGTVLDPANGVESRLNLLVEDGRIAAVTSSLPRADRVIDAAGKLVLPGFIDIHMHEDPVGADGRIACGIFDCMLRMGVTTAAGGNCGINRCDPVEYLDLVDRDGAPVNVLLFAGHHYFREQAGALDKYAPITPEQAARLRSSLQRALDGGCAGISYGLRYVPGTSREEFLDTASCCAKSGKLLTAHIRGDALDVFSAVEEAAEAGRRFGIPVQISHIGSMAGFGQMAEVLRQIDEYRMNGLDIQCDCYPY
ncbi:MAG: amidohydrolase family protein, partial [Oscillospiraceae bacterium]|nr:amidohydrolase family protein [Oscillospiraceae bacterium]